MRLFLLLFFLFSYAYSAAIGPPGASSSSSRRFDRLIHSVVRKSGQPDVIHPTVCPPSCEHIHQAIDHVPNITLTSSLSDECACSCPAHRPVYLSSAGACVDKLQECQSTIRWKTTNPYESNVPVVHLFPHSVILPNTPLNFEASDIIVSSKGQANCTITRLFYENILHRWKTPPRKTVLFELTDLEERPIIYFRGTEFDASFLSGAVVQIKLRCDTRSKTDEQFCISLRIAGVSGTQSSLDRGSSQFEEPGWRIEMILLLAFVSFVVITLLATLIIWNICWKIKKRKLISDFQLQFIQQFKHQHGNKLNAQMTPDDIEIDEDSVSPHNLLSNRRRLYFSADYFERELLENPPPMAEQFLFDLRRMVDVAKDRIRQRRFNPSLITIPEMEEGASSHISVLETNENEMMSSQESSPRSEPKSVDSGRESKEDSEDSEDSEEERERPKETNEHEQERNFKNLNQSEKLEDLEKRGVSEIVKNFEKTMARPSQLPVLLTSSMRRKSAGDKPTTPKTTTPTSRLPLPTPATSSPRPNSLIAERRNEIESRIKPPTVTYGGRSLKEKKGYAVFPSDGTFNKSLPRRLKRITTSAST